MRTPVAATVLALLAAACAPVLTLADGAEADRLRDVARAYCGAVEAADPEAMADLMTPDLAAAIREAAVGGQAISGLDAACTPGRAAYWGGSRRFVEVRRGRTGDALDLWLADQGRIRDVLWGDRPGSLRRDLGLPVETTAPRRVFR